MSLLYLCEFQNSSGDICLYRYFTRAGKAFSWVECAFYRQTIQLLHLRQQEFCCIKALTVYSFRLLSDTWLSQACAKSEPSGRCFWGNKYSQQRHGSVQHVSSAVSASSEPPWAGSIRRAQIWSAVSLLQKPHVSLHTRACEPCCAWGNRICPSGKESSETIQGYRWCSSHLCCLACCHSVSMTPSQSWEAHKRCVIRTIYWHLTLNHASPNKDSLEFKPSQGTQADREHLKSIRTDTSDFFVLNFTESSSSGYLMYLEVQKLL